MSKAWLDVEIVKRTRVAARTVFMGDGLCEIR
jgi:hypothetical protein